MSKIQWKWIEITPHETKSDDYNVTTADFWKSLRMEATSDKQFNLPSVDERHDGARITFIKCSSNEVAIQAADADSVADSAPGGAIYNYKVAETWAAITLEYVHSITTWCILCHYGTWVTTASSSSSRSSSSMSSSSRSSSSSSRSHSSSSISSSSSSISSSSSASSHSSSSSSSSVSAVGWGTITGGGYHGMGLWAKSSSSSSSTSTINWVAITGGGYHGIGLWD